MVRLNKLADKEVALKERVRLILACLFSIVVLSGALIFFINTAGASIIGIFTGVDAVFYDWRAVVIVLYFPVIGYFDVLVFLFLFLPFTSRLIKLWGKLSKIIFAYIIFAFFFSLPLSLYIHFFPLADYLSCGVRNPYYVKDISMCEQFEYHPENEKSDPTSNSDSSADGK